MRNHLATARARLAVGLAVAVLGCQAEPAPTPIPTALTLVTQPSAQVRSGARLERQPIVELRDQTGKPVSARAVQITVALVSGGGILLGTPTARTDDQGRAAFVDLGLAGLAGSYGLQFSATGLAGVASEPIGMTAGEAAQIEVVAGNGQVTAAGTVVPVVPVVRLRDESGNPVAGIQVAFAVSEGGGSVDGATSASGADGLAAPARWTLGRIAGNNTLTATGAGLSIGVGAIGVVGPAAKIAVIAGAAQSGVIGTGLAVAPKVGVTDAFDNPLAGVQVAFAADTGGRVDGGSTQTDGLGVAVVGRWILGLVPGVNTLTAKVGSLISTSVTAIATHYQVGSITAGVLGACAIDLAGAAGCWGDNTNGQLGDGTTTNAASPVAVRGGLRFRSIEVGSGHTCGVTTTGVGYCWGGNGAGQIGDSSTVVAALPSAVAGGHQWSSIAVGDFHSCGLDQAGVAWCWGLNANGRLGDSSAIAKILPVAVAGGHRFTALTAGASHTCGLRSDHQVLCWGAGANGRLGVGGTTEQRVPTVVAAVGGSFTAVSAGGSHTCAVTSSGAAMCWGNNTTGALGDGATAPQLVPVLVGGSMVVRTIAAGFAHTCAVTQSDRLFCWGSNGSGRLGDGTGVNRLLPTEIAPGLTFAEVATGADHTCARTTAGSAVCWGNATNGQIGDGTTDVKPRPVGVLRPPQA